MALAQDWTTAWLHKGSWSDCEIRESSVLEAGKSEEEWISE